MQSVRVLGGFITLSLLLTPDIAAAVNISAGSVNAAAGQSATVPIAMSLGSADVEVFGVTFTLVPQEGASPLRVAHLSGCYSAWGAAAHEQQRAWDVRDGLRDWDQPPADRDAGRWNAYGANSRRSDRKL